jgi:hypothetical protein
MVALKTADLPNRPQWTRLLITSAIFTSLTGVALVAFESNSSSSSTAAAAQAATANESPLGLSVTAQKQQLEIRWNHDSIGPLGGYKGQMKISEGETTQTVRLDWRDLEDGHVSYTPLTNDVRIVLELVKPDGNIIRDSVHAAGFFHKH